MTSKTFVLSIFALTAILIGSLSIGNSVFATGDYRSWDNDHEDKYDKYSHHGKNKSNDSADSRFYVNSLSFDRTIPNGLDSCDAHDAPCILINPFNAAGNMETIFIADPELKNTRTVVTVNVFEKDNFPTIEDDIITFPECFEIGVAAFNAPTSSSDLVNGVILDCTSTDAGEFDVSYSFTGTDQNFIDEFNTVDDCDCTKPTEFTVRYEGPDNVTVQIWKSHKHDGELKNKLVDYSITYISGDEIIIDSKSWGKDKLSSNTTYAFYDENEVQIGTVDIHTSCSKDLYIDQIWTSEDSDITLTVVSGYDQDEQSAIPILACLDD